MVRHTLDATDEGLDLDAEELAEGAGERGGDGATACAPAAPPSDDDDTGNCRCS